MFITTGNCLNRKAETKGAYARSFRPGGGNAHNNALYLNNVEKATGCGATSAEPRTGELGIYESREKTKAAISLFLINLLNNLAYYELPSYFINYDKNKKINAGRNFYPYHNARGLDKHGVRIGKEEPWSI